MSYQGFEPVTELIDYIRKFTGTKPKFVRVLSEPLTVIILPNSYERRTWDVIALRIKKKYSLFVFKR